MGQTLMLSRPPEARPPVAGPPAPVEPLAHHPQGLPDPFEPVFESEPTSRLIPQVSRRRKPGANGAASRLAEVLSRTARPMPREAPANGAERTSRKRSAWSFGHSPATVIADDLDPLPFVADERCARDELRWPDVEIVNLPSRGPSQERGLTTPAPSRARLMEVNLGAIALGCQGPIPPGTILQLRLDAGSGSQLEIGAEVVRGEERESGHVAICRLRRHLSFAEIQKIGRGIFASILV